MVPTSAVELCPHDPAWRDWAAREGERLQAGIGEALVTVHHIGSTAIPGIRAKPLLDLIPVFRSLAELDAARDRFASLGYQWRGEYGLPRRRYCTLVSASGRRLVHAHCYALGDSEIDRHLAFRDYLRAHSDIARAYEVEKLRCQLLHADNSAAYSEAKHAWIQRIQADAISWWNGRRRSGT